MVKKLVVTVGVLLVGGYLLGLGSYIGTLWERANRYAQESVPPDVELERIQYLINSLDEDIETAKSKLASARVRVTNLQGEVVALREELARDRAYIVARGEELKAATGLVKLTNGTSVTVDEAKERLAADVETYNARHRDLDRKERTLAIQIRTRDTIQGQYEALHRNRQEWQTAHDELEAELELLELEQLESDYQNDDSRSAEIKQSIQKLSERIAVDRETLRIDEEFGADPVLDRSVDEILGELEGFPEGPLAIE